MFRATPRLFRNSPNRRLPAKASRTIRSDHQSPTASSDRATGHAAVAKLVRLTAESEKKVNRFQGATTLTVYQVGCTMQRDGKEPAVTTLTLSRTAGRVPPVRFAFSRAAASAARC